MNELKDKIEELEETIEELNEDNAGLQQEVDDLQGDITTLNDEVCDLESDSVNREEFAEKCFKAGNPELWIGKSAMQAWLNFRMEIGL